MRFLFLSLLLVCSIVNSYGNENIFKVFNRTDFIKAILNHKENDKIMLLNRDTLDLSDLKNIEIKSNVTIMGTEFKSCIKLDTHGVNPLFSIIGNNVKFRNLNIIGNDKEVFHKGINKFEGQTKEFIKENYYDLYFKTMYGSSVSSAIYVIGSNFEIDNCEFSGWTYTAILFERHSKNNLVRNSFFHHNQRFGLGYGITINGGDVIIERNFFSNNRHSIASTGRQESSYIVRENVFYMKGSNLWAIDVHGGVDRGDGTNIAGKSFVIDSNFFIIDNNEKAVVIRGVPDEDCVITNNKVYYSGKSNLKADDFFEQRNGQGNFRVINDNLLFY